MDSYTEQILQVNPSGKQRLMLAGAISVIAVGAFLAICVNGNLGLTLLVIGAVLTGFAANAQKYEYEYAFTNGDCDIARIVNRASRKDVCFIAEGDVLRILPYQSEKFQNELQVNTQLAVKDFTSGNHEAEAQWYAFMISQNGVSTAVILELNEKSFNHVKSFFKKKLEV